MLTLAQIQSDLKDIRYYYSRKYQFESAKTVVSNAMVSKAQRYN